MKYKLMKDLPFALAGSLFAKGSWVGGGWGIDQGNDSHGAHNGTKTFDEPENKILDRIIAESDITDEWIRQIPTWDDEAVELYDKKLMTKKELIAYLKNTKL